MTVGASRLVGTKVNDVTDGGAPCQWRFSEAIKCLVVELGYFPEASKSFCKTPLRFPRAAPAMMIRGRFMAKLAASIGDVCWLSTPTTISSRSFGWCDYWAHVGHEDLECLRGVLNLGARALAPPPNAAGLTMLTEAHLVKGAKANGTHFDRLPIHCPTTPMAPRWAKHCWTRGTAAERAKRVELRLLDGAATVISVWTAIT